MKKVYIVFKKNYLLSTVNCQLVFLLILITWPNVNTTHAQVINRAEYFVDVDPGAGNATSVSVPSPAANVNFNFNIPTTSLSTGFHVLGFRMRQSINGRWSHTQFNSFYIVPLAALPAAVNLIRGEYFFDADPGFGNGTSIPVTPSSSVSIALNNISISALTPGFHTISFRFQDDKAKWTHAHAQTFYIVPPSAIPTATTITKAEYFFDTDLGAGNNTSIPVSAGSPLTINTGIPLGSLPTGFHKLGIRYRDNRGKWSHAEVRSFYILNANINTPAEIVAAEYFVDTDPGIGAGTKIPGIVQGATMDQLVALDMDGVTTGAHTLNIRVKDSKGFWSYHESALFTVSSCTPPGAPTATGASRCSAGTLDLTASGATGTQEYRWYDDPILSNIIFTGSTFTTSSLNTSKLYYVSIYDPATTCESSRTTVNATVTILPKPAINPSGNLSFCEGSSIFLSATSGASQYLWSNSQATQQILANTSGTFTVQISDGTCLSEASDPVVITAIPAPAKPIISISGNTTICGAGSVDLTGPDGVEYAWSTGATTQTITVSQTGVFFLTVKSGANCPSLPSDPVVVNILTPPCGGGNNQSPVIDNTPLASTIEGTLTVDLTTLVSDPDNNLDYTTMKLSDTKTARGGTATIDASYNLVIDYAGLPFTGVDRVTLEVCDLAGACVQQVLDIEVVGTVVVYTGLSPDGDGKNDFMLIKYIDVIEGANQNKVTILNRWGDIVFDVTNYNNNDRVFAGLTKNGSELPSGTYFYKIEFSGGSKPLNGFLTLIR
ncbi:MAG TPA: gliding motility-associated C-terminal domain-containing protein [Ohtaekwangia sp.]